MSESHNLAPAAPNRTRSFVNTARNMGRKVTALTLIGLSGNAYVPVGLEAIHSDASADTPAMCGHIPLKGLDTSPINVQRNHIDDVRGHHIRLDGMSVFGGLQQGDFDAPYAKKSVDAQIISSVIQWSDQSAVNEEGGSKPVVRLQMAEANLELHQEAFFKEADREIALATGLGARVDLNDNTQAEKGMGRYHHTDGPTKLSQRFMVALAKRYKCLGGLLILDTYNEPMYSLPSQKDKLKMWVHGGMYHGYRIVGEQQIVNAIRKVNKHVLIQLQGWDVAQTLEGVRSNTIKDANVEYNIHHAMLHKPWLWFKQFINLSKHHATGSNEAAYYSADRKECTNYPGGDKNLAKLVKIWKSYFNNVDFWTPQVGVMINRPYKTYPHDNIIKSDAQQTEQFDPKYATTMPLHPVRNFCSLMNRGIGKLAYRLLQGDSTKQLLKLVPR